MIEPHVLQGGASSWFCIDENFEARGLALHSAVAAKPEDRPELLDAANQHRWRNRMVPGV